MTAYADFEEFVAARRDALPRTAYLLTGDHHDAEDLVQSALIKVVPKWARVRDRLEPYVRQELAREAVSRCQAGLAVAPSGMPFERHHLVVRSGYQRPAPTLLDDRGLGDLPSRGWRSSCLTNSQPACRAWQ